MGKNPAGSSPRMWGTQPLHLYEGEGQRFIPTHVGNTDLDIDLPLTLAVHPHACGEHLLCNR